jgi:hypothetical protein
MRASVDGENAIYHILPAEDVNAPAKPVTTRILHRYR